MNITLTNVDKNNYEDVCDLSVAESQYDYVAENMWSLVESKFNPSYQTRAICLDEKPVDFSCGSLKQLREYQFGYLW